MSKIYNDKWMEDQGFLIVSRRESKENRIRKVIKYIKYEFKSIN